MENNKAARGGKGEQQREVVIDLDGNDNSAAGYHNTLSEIKETIAAESNFTRRQLADQGKQIGKLLETSNGLGKALKTLTTTNGKVGGVGGPRQGPVTRSVTAKMTLAVNGGRGGRSTSKVVRTGQTGLTATGRKRGSRSRARGDDNENRELMHGDARQLNEPDESDEWSDVDQDTLGSPFTYKTHDKCHSGLEMPWCFDLVWRPPGGMIFVGAELAVAAYVYSDDLDKEERLVDDEYCNGTRKELQILVPGEEVSEDVIDMVIGKLASEKDKLCWFLPTEFSRMAMHPDEWDAAKIDYLREHYMGKYEKVSKVFIPMIRNHHWFLLVIDTVPGTLTYFDSSKDINERQARIRQLNYVAYFLEISLKTGDSLSIVTLKNHSFQNLSFVRLIPHTK